MNFWIVAGLALVFGYYCVYAMWTENIWLHSLSAVSSRIKSKDLTLKELLTLLLFFLIPLASFFVYYFCVFPLILDNGILVLLASLLFAPVGWVHLGFYAFGTFFFSSFA